MVVIFPLALSVLLCTVTTLLSFIIRKVLYTLDAPPYTDAGFKYLAPDWSGAEYYPLYINTCYLSIFMAGTFYLILRNPFRWIILRRMCFLLSLAEIIYFVQLVVTRFPDPNPALHDDPMIFDMFHVLYVTVFLTIQFYEYSAVLRAVYLPLALFGLWLLIPTHLFYSIDLLTACFSVICVFFIYHWYVRNAVAISKRALLVWFESDALNLLLSEDELYHKKLIALAQGKEAPANDSTYNAPPTAIGGATASAAQNSDQIAATAAAAAADLPSLQFYSTGQAEFSVKLEIPTHLNNPLNVLVRDSRGGFRPSTDDLSNKGNNGQQQQYNYNTTASSDRQNTSMSNINNSNSNNNNNNDTSNNTSENENDDDQQRLQPQPIRDDHQNRLRPRFHQRSKSGNHWVNEHGFEVGPTKSSLFNPFRSPSYLDAKIKADVFQRATERLVRFVRATYNDKQKMIHLFGVSAIGGGLGVIAGFANLGAVQITDVERPIGVPLPRDIIYEHFPKVWDHAADVFVYTLMALTGLLILYRKERFTILRRTGTLYFCIMILRVFTVTSTFPVDPSPICKHREHPPGTTCGDLIFSGHTVALLLASLVWSDYFDNSYIRNAFVIAFIWVFCLTGIVLVVLSKLHYTRDVLTAAVVVTSFYHMWQVSVFLRPDVLLRHPWLRWFELDQFIVMEQDGMFSSDESSNNDGDNNSNNNDNNNDTTVSTTVSLNKNNNDNNNSATNSSKNVKQAEDTSNDEEKKNKNNEESPVPVGGSKLLESPTSTPKSDSAFTPK